MDLENEDRGDDMTGRGQYGSMNEPKVVLSNLLCLFVCLYARRHPVISDSPRGPQYLASYSPHPTLPKPSQSPSPNITLPLNSEH